MKKGTKVLKRRSLKRETGDVVERPSPSRIGQKGQYEKAKIFSDVGVGVGGICRLSYSAGATGIAASTTVASSMMAANQ